MPPPTTVPSIDDIRRRTHEALGIKPCIWQAEVAQAIMRRDKDVISIAGTGSGKTLTFWIPLLFQPQGIQIVVTPLNILGKQQADQLKEAGINAIPIRGDNATHENFKAIEDGQYRAVIISPEEMLKKDGGFMKILANDAFASQIISVIWDEGHCIGPSNWGSFRPAYKDAARLRYLLPSHIPYYVTSATLDARTLREVKATLQIREDNVVMFVCSNDRPNIDLTVRKMAHSMRSYGDLAFLIPDAWKPGDTIPKFLVFFDSIAESVAAARVLRKRLPPAMRCHIRWFNSEMSSQFRDKAQGQYKQGGVWGLYCTDSFGMGVDLPDIELVVQWRATCDMRTLWQRFGRAARDPSRRGKALLLAEPKWFDDEREKKKAAAEKREAKREAKRKASAEGVVGRPKKRRAVNASDGAPTARAVEIDEEEEDDPGMADSDDDSDDEVEGEGGGGTEVGASREEIVRDRATRQKEQCERLRDLITESWRAEERAARTRTKTKKAQELTLDMDNFVNASSRPHRCFRVPILALFAQDKTKSRHLECRPDLPAGCQRCHIIPSKICCSLCHPESFTNFAILPSTATTNSAAPSRSSRIDSKYQIMDKEKTLSLDLHAFRKRRTVDQLGDAQMHDMGPSAFMPNAILKRIVDCARAQKIQTAEQLQKETQWKAEEADLITVVAMAAHVYPAPQPFVRTPLVRRQVAPQAAGSVGQGGGQVRARKCGRCKQTGHNAANFRCPLHPRNILAQTGGGATDENHPPADNARPAAARVALPVVQSDRSAHDTSEDMPDEDGVRIDEPDRERSARVASSLARDVSLGATDDNRPADEDGLPAVMRAMSSAAHDLHTRAADEDRPPDDDWPLEEDWPLDDNWPPDNISRAAPPVAHDIRLCNMDARRPPDSVVLPTVLRAASSVAHDVHMRDVAQVRSLDDGAPPAASHTPPPVAQDVRMRGVDKDSLPDDDARLAEVRGAAATVRETGGSVLAEQRPYPKPRPVVRGDLPRTPTSAEIPAAHSPARRWIPIDFFYEYSRPGTPMRPPSRIATIPTSRFYPAPNGSS